MPGDAEKKVGRGVMGIEESLLWSQRIGKESHVNAKANGKFSLRNAVGSLDVPAKFKPGHIDPAAEIRNNKRWKPEDNGWVDSSAETKEFRRCIETQSGGPRNFQAFPATAAQELGWLLSHPGAPDTRIKHLENNRLGIGYVYKTPKEWTEGDARIQPVQGMRGSQPSLPPRGSTGGGAQVMAAPRPLPPYAVSGCDRSPGLSRAVSTPAIVPHPAEHLAKREAKAKKVVKQALRYSSTGEIGYRYSRFLNGTDATAFDNDFTVANCGVPLYMMKDPVSAVVLKDKFGMPAGKWR